jgi:hypothetical protein
VRAIQACQQSGRRLQWSKPARIAPYECAVPRLTCGTESAKVRYIDARPLTASLAKSTCNARPDHTFGSIASFWRSAGLPQLRTYRCTALTDAMCHVWTAPSWEEESSRRRLLPCVRPLGAVHMTAGHDALRGSGPSQQRAFDDAMAQVGCPDRRIDRLCITCCSPSQPSHHAGCPTRSRLRHDVRRG